jgi:hypothetical protein
MTTLLAGIGPAGRGVLTAMLAAGILPEVCDDGFVVVDPELVPGGGALCDYNVRSDSAAVVFAECVKALRHEPDLTASSALATILALPDGETVALPVVGRLLCESTAPLLRQLRTLGADVLLGTRVTAVSPHAAGGASVTVTDWAGHSMTFAVSRLILALGGEPHVPEELANLLPGEVHHSDELLRPAGLARALDALPPDPRIVVIGRAHSAFAVADRLLSSARPQGWSDGAVTVATRGQVRVTYPDVATARADGACFTLDDVCPQSRRVWRLCGLRGDSARRYRLGRDGLDARLAVAELQGSALADRASRADLVVAATGYRAAALRLLPGAMTAHPDGSLVDRLGRHLPGIRTIGLGSGSRRSALAGGEPSYSGPVDGVWHYQTVLAPAMLEDLFGPAPRGQPARAVGLAL